MARLDISAFRSVTKEQQQLIRLFIEGFMENKEMVDVSLGEEKEVWLTWDSTAYMCLAFYGREYGDLTGTEQNKIAAARAKVKKLGIFAGGKMSSGKHPNYLCANGPNGESTQQAWQWLQQHPDWGKRKPGIEADGYHMDKTVIAHLGNLVDEYRQVRLSKRNSPEDILMAVKAWLDENNALVTTEGVELVFHNIKKRDDIERKQFVWKADRSMKNED